MKASNHLDQRTTQDLKRLRKTVLELTQNYSETSSLQKFLVLQNTIRELNKIIEKRGE